MRLGIVLAGAGGRASLEGLAWQASIAEEQGFELGWLDASPTGTIKAPLAAAAALAPTTTVLRFAAEVGADAHPVTIAEEAAVVDLATNGRLVLVLRHDSDADRLAETTDIVLAAGSSRPFRHEGALWNVPANLPENEDHERRILVAPAPAQLELPVWLSGDAAPGPARERGLAHVSAKHGEDAAREWRATEQMLRAAALRLRRPGLVDVAVGPRGVFDEEQLITKLLRERDAWGLDVAVFRFPGTAQDAERTQAMQRIAALVRPRVQLDAVPEHLATHWRETLSGVTPSRLN